MRAKGRGGTVSYHLVCDVCDVCDVCVGDKRGEAGEGGNGRMDNEGRGELREEEDRKGKRERNQWGQDIHVSGAHKNL